MTREEEISAIGLAVKAADDSARNLKALAAKMHNVKERYVEAAKSLQEICLHDPKMRIHNLALAMKELPNHDDVLSWQKDYDEAMREHPVIQERAAVLRGSA